LEDVNHDEAVVVEEVFNTFFGEVVVGVGELGDALDGVDAVDEGDDLNRKIRVVWK